MVNKVFAAILTMSMLGTVGMIASADEDEGSPAKVAKFLASAKVTLQEGLTAAGTHGQPISGKFEVDEGHFQLSVYTNEGGKLSEVIVDHTTGKVAKTEAITGGEDLTDATKQMQASAKAKKPLKSAVDQAEQANPGYRAISVTPKLSDGRAVAAVVLLKGTRAKSVSEALE